MNSPAPPKLAAAIEKIVLGNPAAQFLAELATVTEDPYRAFLREVRRWKPEGGFAPWDVLFVMARIGDEIDGEFHAAYPRAQLEARLRASLLALGFAAEHPRIVFVESRYQIIKDGAAEPGVYIELQNDPSRIQFGSTQDFGQALGIALAEVNVSKDGHEGYQILFHECGHALHFLNIQSRYALTRMAMPSFFTEGIAKVFESLPLDAGWLAAHASLSSVQIRKLQRLCALRDIYTLRENAMYAMAELLISHSAGDPDEIWHALASTALYPECEDREIVAGGFRLYGPRVINHPQSALNIVITACIAAQIRAHIAGADRDTIYVESARETLTEFIRPGGSADWQQIMRKATGSELDAEPIASEFSRRLAA